VGAVSIKMIYISFILCFIVHGFIVKAEIYKQVFNLSLISLITIYLGDNYAILGLLGSAVSMAINPLISRKAALMIYFVIPAFPIIIFI
jgi:hypothetical protein